MVVLFISAFRVVNLPKHFHEGLDRPSNCTYSWSSRQIDLKTVTFCLSALPLVQLY